jgi:hypothetical protein
LGISFECPSLTVVRDRNNTTAYLPAARLKHHLQPVQLPGEPVRTVDWVWDAKDSSKARKAFEHPDLEFLQDAVAETAKNLAGGR